MRQQTEITEAKTIKDHLKAWTPTLLVLVSAIINQFLLPYLTASEPIWSWPAFGVVALSALINSLKLDDNPVRYWDTTLSGCILALLTWIVTGLSKQPVTLDWKELLVVVLPILLGSFTRGLAANPRTQVSGT